MALLVLDVALMVACVQFGFRGLSLLYSRADVEQWLPLTSEPRAVELRRIAVMQRSAIGEWRNWHSRSVIAYNLGVLLLGAGLTLILAPPEAYVEGTALSPSEAGARWAGFGIAAVATMLELGWILRDNLLPRRRP
jgi:hypothetical protein